MSTTNIPRAYHYLRLALGIILFSACTGSQVPSLKISKANIKDSIAYLYLRGDSTINHSDTLVFKEEVLSLEIDTMLYKEAFVSFGSGDSVRYYRLRSGSWEQAIPTVLKDTIPSTFPAFYIADVERKYRGLSEIARGRLVAISFARLDNTMPSKRSLKALDSLYKKDSLKHVYMYLATSDSLVKNRMKRDSLKGIAFSDTLGEVSLLRQRIGIAQSNRIHTFVVDSTMRIVKRQ